MLKVTGIIFLVLLALVSSSVIPENNLRVFGGLPTIVGEFPSVVQIRIFGQPNELCSGTIVNENHVVTSAQCVMAVNNQIINRFWLEITGGTINLNIPSVRRVVRSVSAIYVHNGYVAATRANDIAVLRVSEPFVFPHNTVEPALRNNGTVRVGTQCQFAGWGTLNAAPTGLDPIQRRLNAPIIATATCNPLHVNLNVNAQMICAGVANPAAGTPGVCHGNLGGGLFCNDQLTGILSFGIGCGAVNTPPAVYTNIQPFNAWINQQFLRTDMPRPGTAP